VLYMAISMESAGCDNRYAMILLPGDRAGELWRRWDGRRWMLVPRAIFGWTSLWFFNGTARHRRKVDPSNAESQPRAEYSVY